MINDALVAAEGVRFGKSRRAAGHKRERLVVAEAAKELSFSESVWSSRISNLVSSSSRTGSLT